MPRPPAGDGPRYRIAAAELRRRIMAGAIPPGALLPSEAALTREFGLSRGVVREAMALLRAEGLVVTEMGRGTYARPVLPIRRLGSERYGIERDQVAGAPTPATSFTADHALTWSDYRLDTAFQEL